MTNKKKEILAKDFMTRDVISVSPESSIADAIKIITRHGFDGLPVVDSNNRLVGILTEYNLITKTSDLSTSFLERILDDVYALDSRDEKKSISPGTKNISEFTVSDVMDPEPITLREDATFGEVIGIFRDHHRINPIPVINDQREVVGIVSRYDILRPLNILSHSAEDKNNL